MIGNGDCIKMAIYFVISDENYIKSAKKNQFMSSHEPCYCNFNLGFITKAKMHESEVG
jgi:hypothetical protein